MERSLRDRRSKRKESKVEIKEEGRQKEQKKTQRSRKKKEAKRQKTTSKRLFQGCWAEGPSFLFVVLTLAPEVTYFCFGGKGSHT